MSDDDDDETGSYVAVPGFSISFQRVLDAEERPANSDGSRTGSLFMTHDGCTFTHDGVHGDAAATWGAPNVVVTVCGPGECESRYLISVEDMIKAAISAHKARKDWPAPKTK